MSSDQVADALAASRARVAQFSRGMTSETEAAASEATALVDLVDLTASSPVKGTEKDSQTNTANNDGGMNPVTPTPAAARVEMPVRSLPCLTLYNGGEARNKRLKVRDDNFGMQPAGKTKKSSGATDTKDSEGKASKNARVSLDAENTSEKALADDRIETSDRSFAPKTAEASSAKSKAARVSLDVVDKTISNGSESVEADDPSRTAEPTLKASKAARVSDAGNITTGKSTEPVKATKQSATSQEPKSDTGNATNPNKCPSSQITSTSATITQPKKKKRSFHDQILYTMLTTSQPYSLKSLAKACDTTTAALHHAMLSFLDKQLVISKEFPSKNGEPKKLYWANPLSLNELNGKSALAKEMGKLLATPEEMEEARRTHGELQSKLRGVVEELNPLVAVPTSKQMDEQILREESELNKLQEEIRAIRARMESATEPKPRQITHGRFQKPTKPMDKPTLKRKINRMLSEYKQRKRKCVDFVENLADAMEKKVKDVTSEKVLGLETDEMQWGRWVDGGTGKVFGAVKKGKSGEEEVPKVKIPAKYTDV